MNSAPWGPIKQFKKSRSVNRYLGQVRKSEADRITCAIAEAAAGEIEVTRSTQLPNVFFIDPGGVLIRIHVKDGTMTVLHIKPWPT